MPFPIILAGALLTAGLQPGASASQASAAVAAYAQCLARHNSVRVTHALEAGFGDQFDAAVSRLAVKACVSPESVAVTGGALRGPLFRAMYTKFGPAAGRTAATIITKWSAKLPAGSALLGWYQIGSCVIDKAPGLGRDLVRTAPGSEKESAKLAAITPSLSNCLPGGQQVAINRSVLIGVLSEIVYRIDVAPPAAGNY
jgi:hypothetical protein